MIFFVIISYIWHKSGNFDKFSPLCFNASTTTCAIATDSSVTPLSFSRACVKVIPRPRYAPIFLVRPPNTVTYKSPALYSISFAHPPAILKSSIVSHDNRDVPLAVRENFNENIKLSVAKKAAALITNGSTVFIDASSTASFVANFIEPEQNITVITNGIKALTILSQRHIRAYCIGGRLINNSLAFTGAIALRTIGGMHADFMFFSSQGLSCNGKITDFSESETELRMAMLEHSTHRYFLCDNSKIGKTFLFNVCDADDIDGVICDIDYRPQE